MFIHLQIKSEDDFSLRIGSFGRATVADNFHSKNIKSKFFEASGINKN